MNWTCYQHIVKYKQKDTEFSQIIQKGQDKNCNLNMKDCQALNNMKIFFQPKTMFDTPLQLAAYFLNPYYSYNDPTIFASELVMDGLMSAVETFYHGDYDKQNQVVNEELIKFKDQVGHFAKLVAKAGWKDFDFNPGNDSLF